ncbi:hypothetical protein ES703_95907 [subsurface metagenome]
MLIRPLISFSHYSTQGCRSCVKEVNLIFLHNIPKSIRIWIGRNTLKHKAGSTKSQRPIHNITMSGNPANVSSTPPSILLLNIKYPLEGLVAVQEIASLGMKDTFRLPGAATSIKDKEGVLGIHHLGLTIRFDILSSHFFMPPVVTPFLHLHFSIGSLDHNCSFYLRALFQGSISIILAFDNSTTAIIAIRTNEDCRLTIQNPVPQCLSTKPTENNIVNSTNSCAGKHSNRQF